MPPSIEGLTATSRARCASAPRWQRRHRRLPPRSAPRPFRRRCRTSRWPAGRPGTARPADRRRRCGMAATSGCALPPRQPMRAVVSADVVTVRTCHGCTWPASTALVNMNVPDRGSANSTQLTALAKLRVEHPGLVAEQPPDFRGVRIGKEETGVAARLRRASCHRETRTAPRNTTHTRTLRRRARRATHRATPPDRQQPGRPRPAGRSQSSRHREDQEEHRGGIDDKPAAARIAQGSRRRPRK